MHFESHGRVPNRHGRKTNQKPEVLRRQTVAAREQGDIVLAEPLWHPQFSIQLARARSCSQSLSVRNSLQLEDCSVQQHNKPKWARRRISTKRVETSI